MVIRGEAVDGIIGKLDTGKMSVRLSRGFERGLHLIHT
jgi:hypothetical protein